MLFQAFKAWRVDSFKAIVINYGVAAVFGWWLAEGWTTFHRAWNSDWRWVAIGLAAGGLFIYLFQLIARSAQENGVTVTSISAKLSMVIPVAIFLVFDPGDAVTFKKIVAIGLAIPAIVLSSWKPEQPKNQKNWLIPMTIFVGSGMIDLMFATFSGPEFMLETAFRYLFPSLPLSTAFITGVFWLMFSRRQQTGSEFSPKATLAGGIFLGIINFGSLYFLLETYDKVNLDKSAIMPINNLGIIIASAILSLFIFREKLYRPNLVGLLLGGTAIALLYAEQSL
jgi:drug/metabolite transporter (DMT)-like permease